MKIGRLKEKAAQNPRKSSSEARISCNSGVGDSRNSLGRRCFGASGAPKNHRGDGRVSNFGGPGPALSILLRKIQRKQEPKGLRDWCPGSNTPLGRANYVN